MTFNLLLAQRLKSFLNPFFLSSAAEQMDQLSNRSAVGSDDITDDTTSLVDDRTWSSDEEEVK